MSVDRLQVGLVLPSGREVRVGTLVVSRVPPRMGASVNFAYDDAYVSDPEGYELSRDLPLVSGVQPAPLARLQFAALQDAMPDTWGRRLLQQEVRRRAQGDGSRWAPPSEADLLALVPDRTRQGALRFRDAAGHAVGQERGVVGLVDLERLVEAAAQVERGMPPEDEDLALLVAVGTSQGGARPKAAVLDTEGRLAMAKLPSRGDRWDVGAWEAISARLARRAGIDVPDFEVRGVGEDSTVLVTRRFDRVGDRRVGYSSAQSLLLANPGDPVDYALLSAYLLEVSADPKSDGEELLRRIAFTLLVSNVDDHMRNHGLLRTGSGWRLSPMFDVNPFPLGPIEATPITPEDDPADRDIRLLVERASAFGLRADAARTVIAEVAAATADWASYARAAGVAEDRIDQMAPAFENASRRRVA